MTVTSTPRHHRSRGGDDGDAGGVRAGGVGDPPRLGRPLDLSSRPPRGVYALFRVLQGESVLHGAFVRIARGVLNRPNWRLPTRRAVVVEGAAAATVYDPAAFLRGEA
jgi:hypothetical protein